MEGGVGDRWEGNGDIRLVRWEYIVANVILGTEPNAPLAYAPGFEHHHPIMSMLVETEGQLEIEIYDLKKLTLPIWIGKIS